MTKKKTKKKIKKTSKTLLELFEADSASSFENFDAPPTIVNVFDRARKIKTWNMFIHLAEQENITPAEALTIVLKHVKKHWNEFKILKDTDQAESIAKLLEWETKLSRGKLFDHQYLKDFANMTGYKIPRTYNTFQNEMALFRNVFGKKRTKTGAYTKKQLEKAAARALKKGYKGKR
tara:strand:+ start:106 stop:636 length:531 start_codon:yes stop_codon:yes gene_type:complete